MHLPLPLTKELVLIGGGHAHALVMRMWGMTPLPGVRVSVINPGPTAPYTGMLPGYVAGHYSREDLDIDLVRLARFAGARLILERAVDIDTATRRITLGSGRVLPYDVASIDIGITSDLPQIPGFTEHGTPAKPLDSFAQDWRVFRKAARHRSLAAEIAVIGGGIGGVELSLAMQFALKSDGISDPKITVIDEHEILSNLRSRSQTHLRDLLKAANITVIEGARVAAITPEHVQLGDGQIVPARFCVGAAGARAQGWLETSGLDLQDGFVTVDKTLRSVNKPDVFAVGDCAHLSHAPRPKAGVFAVRQAPVLYTNLRAVLSGRKLKPFNPQSNYLKLISLGGKSALADRGRVRVHGRNLWRLKDRIDRKFMNQFHDLQPMKPDPLPKHHALGMAEALGPKPLCGGCGAKVGGTSLAQVMGELPGSQRADVLSEPGDDAAILQGPNKSFQILTTDHLRAFSNDPHTMAQITAIHAMGDVWAMGASPQAVLANIVLPPLARHMQAAWLAEIMGVASRIFTAEGADIVGGHTSIGAELSIGFTLTGLRKKTPLTLSGAKPGDQLILTKPIGTGTILAGEMAMAAQGAWVAQALDQMGRPQSAVAALLDKAHTMTDVTGFGLAGHAHGMALASGLVLDVSLEQIGYFDGAEKLAAAGVRSSIYQDNRDLVPEVDPGMDPRAILLFDPQTAGGLLAAVAPRGAAALCANIQDLGFDARIIGECREGAPGLSVRP